MIAEQPLAEKGPSAAVYTHLLAAALADADRRKHSGATVLLRDVMRRRPAALTAAAPHAVPAATALTLEIGYDVALIRYARCLGIDCGPRDFDRPADGRERMERALAERGIDLD